MPTTLVFVRHGQTDWNINHRFQGSSDIPLNDHGRTQAYQLAPRIQADTFDAVYSSDLSRAHETANIISQQFITQDARLREIAFGVFEGLTFPEIKEQFPDHFELWRRREAPPPEGEELVTVGARVRSFLDDVLEKHIDQRVLIVSHGGIIGISTCLLLDHPPQKVWQFRFENTSISEFGFFPQGIVAMRLNDVCHLTERK